MVQHEQLAHALVADAVLTWQDERVGEELFADGADQLPLNVLDRHLSTGGRRTNKSLQLTSTHSPVPNSCVILKNSQFPLKCFELWGLKKKTAAREQYAFFSILNEVKTGPIVCTAKLGNHVSAVSPRRNNWIFGAQCIYRSSHNPKREKKKKDKHTHYSINYLACFC